MSDTLKKVEMGLKVAETMVSKSEKLLVDAVNSGNWKRAAELESYIDGMKQIIIIFERIN